MLGYTLVVWVLHIVVCVHIYWVRLKDLLRLVPLVILTEVRWNLVPLKVLSNGQICSQDTYRYKEIPSGETTTGKSAQHTLMDDKPPVGACSQSRFAQPATQEMAQFPSHSPQGPAGTAECVGEVMTIWRNLQYMMEKQVGKINIFNLKWSQN